MGTVRMNKIEIYEDAIGEYRWRLVMCGEILAISSEGYVNKSGCWDVVYTVKSLSVELVQSQYRFEFYVDRAGDHRWRLRHRNGNIVAVPPRGYDDPDRLAQALSAAINHASRATVSDRTE